MDVKTTFLHGNIDEKILMEQLECFKTKGKEGHVCLLKKSLLLKSRVPGDPRSCQMDGRTISIDIGS